MGELREWLGNFGDHVPVVLAVPAERSFEVDDRLYEIETVDVGMQSLNGIPVAVISRAGEISAGE